MNRLDKEMYLYLSLWCQNNVGSIIYYLYVSPTHCKTNNLFYFFLFELRICYSNLHTKYFCFIVETALGEFYCPFYCSLTAAMSTHIYHIDVKWYTVIHHNSCCWQIISSILGMDGI